MTIKEHLDLFFNKNKVIKIVIHTPDRRSKQYIRRLEGVFVNINNTQYYVMHDLITLSKGVPVLHYMDDNPEPFDMLEGNIKGVVTGKMIDAVLNNTVFKNMVADLLDRDKKLINTLMIIGGVILLGVGAGTYFLYDKILSIQEFTVQNQSLLDALRDALLNGQIGN